MNKLSILKKSFACVMTVALVLNSATFAGEIDLFADNFDNVTVEEFDLLGEVEAVEEGSQDLPELAIVEEPAATLEEEAPVATEENLFDLVDAPAEEVIFFEDEDPAFVQGYVAVNAEAPVYEAESTEKKIGSFAEKAVVYAVASDIVTAENDNWLKITFDTAEAKEKEESLMTGYVLEKDVTVLTENEAQELQDALILDETSRDFEGKYVPEVKFVPAEEAAAEDIVIFEDEVAEDEAGEDTAVEDIVIEENVLDEEEFDEEEQEVEPVIVEIFDESEEEASEDIEDEITDVVEILSAAEEEEAEEVAEEEEVEAAEVLEEEAVDGEEESFDEEAVLVMDEEDDSAEEDTLEEVNAAASGLAITSNPSDVEANIGDIAEFKVVATGTNLTYQWQYSKTDGASWITTKSLTGYNTATLSVPVTATRIGWQFHVIVTDANGNTVTSEAAKLKRAFAITSNPADVEANVGSVAEFKVVAVGTNLTYQWQYSKTGGASWITTKSLTGYNTDTLSVPVTATRIGWQFHVIVTDENGNTLTSEAAELRSAFAITSNPADVLANVGDTAEFKVVATGQDLTYQWQYSKTEGASWITTKSLTGYNTDTLTVPVTATRFGWQFHVIVTDGNGNTLTSEAAKLNRSFAIITNPSDVKANVGDMAEFKVVAAGEGLTYQWQYSKTDGASWITTKSLTGYNTDTLTVPVTATRIGWQFHVIVTDASGNTLTSEAATLSRAFAITSNPVDVTANIGDMAEFKVVAEGEGLTYQWQYSKTDGASWITTKSLTGYNTDTLTVPVTAARIGWQFHVIVTDVNGNTLTSEAATLSRGFAITSNPADVTANVGDMAEFKVVATGEGLTYQWQYSKNDGATWVTTKSLTGYNTDTLIVPVTATRIGWQFHVIVTDANGNTLTSEAATLKRGFAIITDPADVGASIGDTAEFKVVVSGENLTYQWQYSKNDGATWVTTKALTGYNTDTLSVPVTAARIGWMFHVIVTDGNGNTLTSNAAKLTSSSIVIENVTYEPITSTTCKVSSYSGSASTLVIPETIQGMTVVEIGVEAFMNNTSLASIDLPDTITVISARAFKGCTSLSDMH